MNRRGGAKLGTELFHRAARSRNVLEAIYFRGSHRGGCWKIYSWHQKELEYGTKATLSYGGRSGKKEINIGDKEDNFPGGKGGNCRLWDRWLPLRAWPFYHTRSKQIRERDQLETLESIAMEWGEECETPLGGPVTSHIDDGAYSRHNNHFCYSYFYNNKAFSSVI